MFSRRPSKRKAPTQLSREQVVVDAGEESDDDDLIETHPYGVQPMGNMYVYDSLPVNAKAGLGTLAQLDDAVLQTIFSELSAKDLARASLVSRAFYVFCCDEDLWKPLCFDSFETSFRYQGSWRATYICHNHKEKYRGIRPLKVEGFFSDVLFHSWHGATLDISRWGRTDNMERRDANTLPYDAFVRDFEKPNKPLIITNCVNKWPCYKKWTKEFFQQQYGNVVFATQQAVDMTMSDFLHYCSIVKEENAMYLFDAEFGEKTPELLLDYEVPEYFANDYLELLPTCERPSYRWILIGPKQSGSPFHKDPNSTSAWNGLISGAKKWIMFPPDVVPPGVYPNEDESEVTTPVSVVEWFSNFYSEAKRMSVKPIECVQRPGDLVFVPHGWWHAVLNLEESIAVTQNYIGDTNLVNAIKFLRAKANRRLDEVFEEELGRKHPDTLKNALADMTRAKKKTFWENLSSDKHASFSVFSLAGNTQ